jgi:hypothetical protein
MCIATSRHTAAVFTFIYQVPSLRTTSFYQHRRGNPLETVYNFLRMDAALPGYAYAAEAFSEVSQYAEQLFDSTEDFGERYRYTYDLVLDKLVIMRRKSAYDNLCVARFPLVLGPWFEEFTGTLAEFIATYTHAGVADHGRLRQYDLPTAMPTWC